MSNSHTHVEGETRETCRVCTPGTDRVELTDAEREALLFGFGIRFYENADHTRFAQGAAAVESIVAARVQALTAERDELRQAYSDLRSGTHLLVQEHNAELAAANTRCAELEAASERLIAEATNDHMTSRASIYERGELTQELTDRLEKAEATLDRVTALADEWDGEGIHSDEPLMALCDHEARAVIARLRAALTPEGKP